MRDLVVDAVILSREPRGEQDCFVTLYAKHLGKLSAVAKSGRKITSKLAAHLEPLCVSQVRLVEQSRFTIADALRAARLPEHLVPVLRLIRESVMEGQYDEELWKSLVTGSATPANVLAVLGLNPDGAHCLVCSAGAPQYFLLKEAVYVCNLCLPPTLPLFEFLPLRN